MKEFLIEKRATLVSQIRSIDTVLGMLPQEGAPTIKVARKSPPPPSKKLKKAKQMKIVKQPKGKKARASKWGDQIIAHLQKNPNGVTLDQIKKRIDYDPKKLTFIVKNMLYADKIKKTGKGEEAIYSVGKIRTSAIKKIVTPLKERKSDEIEYGENDFDPKKEEVFIN